MQHHLKRNLTLMALLLVVAATVAVAVLAGGGKPKDDTSGTAHGGIGDSQVRVVTVYSGSEPAPSPSSSNLRAQIVSGRLVGSSLATVLTDENCEPDSQGISHCSNKVRLEGGSALTLRHPHDMMKVACLAPGERVRIRMA